MAQGVLRIMVAATAAFVAYAIYLMVFDPDTYRALAEAIASVLWWVLLSALVGCCAITAAYKLITGTLSITTGCREGSGNK